LGRSIDYLRLSVTDRCNLRCFYCMPRDHRGFERRSELLSFEEFDRLISAFARLGLRRLRITGGEPLLRHDLPALAARLSAVPGIEDLSLSTNAMLLARHATALRRAGVQRVNVSLDTLRPERFNGICAGGNLQNVMDGLMAAKAAGFWPIKINTLALAGINDDEYEDMVRFCMTHGFTLRFIETMPVGSTGRSATEHFLDLRQVIERLGRTFNLVPTVMPGGGPARYYRVNGGELHIGFITPMSQHFCETCNRVRLSAKGTLHLCLGHEHRFEFRPLLRAGASDAELEAAIIAAVARKPARHEFREKPEQIIRFMSATGG
jgi:cyclic pyranopterin phosphate synthase